MRNTIQRCDRSTLSSVLHLVKNLGEMISLRDPEQVELM